MREVEIKAVLRDKEGVTKKLQDLGCVFSKEETQDDTTYTQKVGTLEEFLSNDIYARIRENNNGNLIFTVKYHPGRTKAADGVPTEHEVSIDSRSDMEEILKLFGLQEAVRCRKKRMQAALNEWEVCIDDVEGLGSFIELEHLVADGEDEKAIQQKMLEFLRSLGIAEEDLIAPRYDVALLQKRAVS